MSRTSVVMGVCPVVFLSPPGTMWYGETEQKVLLLKLFRIRFNFFGHDLEVSPETLPTCPSVAALFIQQNPRKNYAKSLPFHPV